MGTKRKSESETRTGSKIQRVSIQSSSRSAFAARSGSATELSSETIQSAGLATRDLSSAAELVRKLRGTSPGRDVGGDQKEPGVGEDGRPIWMHRRCASLGEEVVYGPNCPGHGSGESNGDADSAEESDGEDGVAQPEKVVAEEQFPRAWKRAREEIASSHLIDDARRHAVHVAGTASFGPIRFAKYMIDTLLCPPTELGFSPLPELHVLDLNLAGCEYGLPGHVTLSKIERCDRESVGRRDPEAFSRISAAIVRSIPVGMLGHNEDPDHYLKAIKELLHTAKGTAIPGSAILCLLSIDFESGLGLSRSAVQEITTAIRGHRLLWIGKICPRIVESNAEFLMDCSYGPLDTVTPPGSTFWNLPALEPDELHAPEADRDTESYFRNDRRDDGHPASPLSATKPYALSYQSSATAGPAHIHSVFVCGDLPTNHEHMLSSILNGSVVSLAILDESSPEEHEENIITHSAGDGIPYLTSRNGGSPDPAVLRRSSALGLGLVRGIDRGRRLLYVIAREEVARRLHEADARRILLVHGVAAAPAWAYRDDLRNGLQPLYLGAAKKGMQIVRSRRFKRA